MTGKFNNHAITFSAGSNKSTSPSHSNSSQSYFQSKLSQAANDNNNEHNMNAAQKLMSATSSNSASPEERVLSSSASSASSDTNNYNDGGLANLKAVMKSSNSGNQLMGKDFTHFTRVFLCKQKRRRKHNVYIG